MTRRIHNPDTAADIELRGYLDSEVRRSFVMVAGAGSGKTTSLVKALDHVGTKCGAELRRNGQKVACITYTEIATAEIWSDVGNNPLFHVSTIHSFLWTLAKPFQKDISHWVRQRIDEKLEDLRLKREGFGPRVQSKTREANERDTQRLLAQKSRVESVRSFTYGSGTDYAEGILGHDDIIKMVSHLIITFPLLSKLISRKYPFFFVDESQDTFPEVTDALKSVAQKSAGQFCLGFFGDPMQKIYGHGVGDITLGVDDKRIEKPENFRCPKSVLSVINRIRIQGDGLEQVQGRIPEGMAGALPSVGLAKLFILPSDSDRTQNLNRVRKWLADSQSDSLWVSDSKEADVRILVIVHRIAATRLGFAKLYSALNDGAPESFGTGFREGTLWALKPFRAVLLPLVFGVINDRHFEVMTLLREHSPRLGTQEFSSGKSASQVLGVLKSDLKSLCNLMAKDGTATVGDVLRFAKQSSLLILDERFDPFLEPESQEASTGLSSTALDGVEVDEDSESLASAMASFLACPASELWGYSSYMMDESPYSTQQGIKGAEFQRVLVVLDDEESAHRQYSYDKLLGLKELSKTDLQNGIDGKETVLDRTRRLFYVCCSRATKDLCVVLYTENVDGAVAHLRNNSPFESEDILTLDSMRNASS